MSAKTASLPDPLQAPPDPLERPRTRWESKIVEKKKSAFFFISIYYFFYLEKRKGLIC